MDTRNNILSIYRLRDVSELQGLTAILDQVTPYTQVHISRRRVPAVAGELAGIVTDILISPQVQALTTAAELGALLWATIKCVKAAGKHLRLGKGLISYLMAARAQEAVNAGETELSECVVWGPMNIDLIAGFDLKHGFALDGEEPAAYFMAIAVPRPNERVRTVYSIISANGEIYASWASQTLRDRVPEFLRPLK